MKLGDTFNYTFKVDYKVHKAFLELSNDYNPIHIDDSFAQSKGFKSKIVHGNVLGGFLSFSLAKDYQIKM